MKIELRKIKHSKSLSEETPAYTAQVWINGEHFCDVSNHGTGGPDEHRPPSGVKYNDANFWRALDQINVEIAREFPKIDCTTFGGTGTLDQDLEMICHGLLGDKETEDMIKRDLKRKVMFVHPTDGKVWSCKITGGDVARVIAAVKQRHGITQTINEMPLADAVKLLSTAN